MKSTRVNKMVKISLLSAAAALLMFLEIPICLFYKMDLSEIVVLVGSFALGPLAGIVIEFLKLLIFVLIRGSQTAFVGEIANFFIELSFILPAAFIYKFKKQKSSAVIGLIAGIIIATVVGCTSNAFILIPAYAKAFNMPVDAIVKMGTDLNSNIKNISTFVIMITATFNLI